MGAESTRTPGVNRASWRAWINQAQKGGVVVYAACTLLPPPQPRQARPSGAAQGGARPRRALSFGRGEAQGPTPRRKASGWGRSLPTPGARCRARARQRVGRGDGARRLRRVQATKRRIGHAGGPSRPAHAGSKGRLWPTGGAAEKILPTTPQGWPRPAARRKPRAGFRHAPAGRFLWGAQPRPVGKAKRRTPPRFPGSASSRWPTGGETTVETHGGKPRAANGPTGTGEAKPRKPGGRAPQAHRAPQRRAEIPP